MRKLVVGALVGVLALAVAAIALADTQQTYSQKFSKNKAGASVGTVFKTDSTDPANTANNKQPKSVRTFNIKFPAGTAVNYKAAPVCKEDDNALQQDSGAACKKSIIGSGSARVRLPFPSSDINATVTAFNAKNALILYVVPQGSNPIVLHPKFKGNLKSGPTLSTAVPATCVPPASGDPCRKSDGSAGQEAILTHFDLKTKPTKKGKNILIRAPKKCKKTWAFKATLKYSDGTSKNITSTQKCKR
jgi:hypothetical protein